MSSGENILLCVPNWLGDAVMCLPAVYGIKKFIPSARITVLTRASLLDYWKLVDGIENIISYERTLTNTFQSAMSIRQYHFAKAFIFPNSFRSAFIPFLAGVPSRTGLRGFSRAFMLTDVVESPSKNNSSKQHQAWDYMAIIGLADKYSELQLPLLHVPEAILHRCKQQLPICSNNIFIGVFPGAMRGPSKRWPAEYFVEMAHKLQKIVNVSFLIFGSKHEITLCNEVQSQIGKNSINFAGRTTLTELAGFLKLCEVVVSNDSGGMHLAAAVGTKVVGIFGMTDPSRTGPLGENRRVISVTGIQHSSEIARYSAQAERVLRSILPDRVVSVVLDVLEKLPKDIK